MRARRRQSLCARMVSWEQWSTLKDADQRTYFKKKSGITPVCNVYWITLKYYRSYQHVQQHSYYRCALGLHVNWSLNDPVGFQVLQSRLCIPGTVGTWQNPYPSVDEGERLNEQFAAQLQRSIMATYKFHVCQRSPRARLESTV